ncbi:B3 domain-containing protein Os01g0905400-like [Hordeum vulgare subsp. vulgare]|uniref:B3 domain-containing protein Os01g0905400-like n=1 Tax=Hordeum vulgare subsp. vulgare TaxID=112509 RepID=UPI001D1A47F4|nr:B3 domain-containing protein Os01g0905400-like [Hordeum vulgare subsp. vulgare]
MVEMLEVIKQEQEYGTNQSQSVEEGSCKKVVGGGHEKEPRPSASVKMVKKTTRKQGVSDPQRKRACVDCTKRCARVHGRATASSSAKAPPAATLPSFFKVMTGSFSEKIVRTLQWCRDSSPEMHRCMQDVPPMFAKNISDLADTNVYLKDAFGLRWRVYLCARDGRLSFGHGWRNFVLDHAVAVGEFLVFRHVTRSVFAVQIFAKSACERLHLCEMSKRQSRKRKKNHENGSSVSDRTVKASKKNSEDKDKLTKKKQRACDLLDGDQCKALEYQGHMVDANTEVDSCGGCDFGPNAAQLTTPLAMMDLDDEITDDIFLTADAYEFETDLYSIPEVVEEFPVDNGIEAPVTHGETPGFSRPEMIGSRNCDSSLVLGLCQGEKSAGLKNEQMADARVTGAYSNAAVLGMDMTALPSNVLSEIREEKSSPRIDAAAPSSERATGNCKKDTDYYKLIEFPSEGNQRLSLLAQSLLNVVSAGRNVVCNLQELPCRLPVLPGRKKQGRKVVVLEDPVGRRWPVLYLCTPTFSGFVAGWADCRAENCLREGEACELQLRRGSYSELALRVLRVPGTTTSQ